MARVLLADDNPDIRSALTLLLSTRLKVEIVGEVDKFEDLIGSVADGRPEILLLDWDLLRDPKNWWISVLHQVRPALKVVIICSRPEVAAQALAARADGFISKSEPPERVLRALQSVQPARALGGQGASPAKS